MSSSSSSSSTISRRFLLFPLLLLLCLDLHKTSTVSADPVLVNTFCPNASSALESSFLSNREHLLSSLASNTEQQTNGGFYNTSVGSTGSGSTVYGLFLCRGDVNKETCQTCVTTAVNYTNTTCSRAEEALIWYTECMILYSTESDFYQRTDAEVQVLKLNPYTFSANVTEFMRVVDDMFEEIARNASSGGFSSKKYATLQANFTDWRVWGLGQCLPDLSASDCYGCLNYSIAVLNSNARGRKGAKVWYPSCNIWYELNDFLAAPSPEDLLPPPPPPGGNKESRLKVILAIVFSVAIAMVLVITSIKLLRKLRSSHSAEIDSNDIKATKSLQYEFSTLKVATNHFSDANKLGEGGFGTVYKVIGFMYFSHHGSLTNGEEIAVKRLFRRSNHGAAEFKNEANLVAQLQHKNLVRLLGFCLAGDEKLLVFEFVPNKGLDYYLFNPQRQGQLDWRKRYNIIQGIARGMLYYSHLKTPCIIY